MSHFSATWQEQFIFNVVCFVTLDQYDELNFLYSVCLLKQQFTGRHATLLKLCFVTLDQYDELNFLYSVCLLKQQFTGRHATLLKLCFVTLDLHGKMNSFKWCLLIETAVHR